MHRNHGDAIHVSELACELAELGVKITLVAPGTSNRPLKNVETIDAGTIPSSSLPVRLIAILTQTFRGLYHVVRLRHQFDVLYTRDAFFGFCLVLLSPLIRLPLVFEVNGLYGAEKDMLSSSLLGNFQSWFNNIAEKFLARQAQAVICVTQGIFDVLRDQAAIPPERMHVVGNGVNIDLFSPFVDRETRENLKNDVKLDDDDAVIVFVGALQPWQGLSTLLKAMKSLKLTDRSPVLLIVGDGDERTSLEEQARRLPDHVRVHFTGSVPYESVSTYISLADICVMPFTRRRNEKIGLSPLKLYSYLACGKPVVSTQIPGLEFIETERLGSLVPCDDAEALAQALKMWTENPDRQKDTGLRARHYAEVYASWKITARKVMDVCGQVV
jgi:glycosyltransferase involved in cell wall biosynthesis